MAYGLRLRIEYKDINEILTRINIYQDGYSGAADVRSANAGMRVEWGDQGGEGMPLVYGSACTIYFDAEFDYEFLYLFSNDSKKHRVDVEKAGALFWTGYIEPDGYSEPLIATPYPVECTAYDGLGFLKDTLFLDDSGAAYTGKKTLFEILKICLLKTGLDLPINTAIDWEEILQEAGTDLMKVHKSNCDNYAEQSCYEVIELILRECRILQRLGQWWVISNSNFNRNLIAYFRTNTDGSTTTGTFDPTASGFWYEGQATMEILPALKYLVVIQNYGYIENVIMNGSFDNFSNGIFEGWENMNVIPKQLPLIKDKSYFDYKLAMILSIPLTFLYELISYTIRRIYKRY